MLHETGDRRDPLVIGVDQLGLPPVEEAHLDASRVRRAGDENLAPRSSAETFQCGNDDRLVGRRQIGIAVERVYGAVRHAHSGKQVAPLFFELRCRLVAQRNSQRPCGAADADGDAGAAGYEREPGAGRGFADGVGGGEPRQFLVKRRKAGMGIDPEIVGDFAPRSRTARHRSDHALFVGIGRRHGSIDAAEQIPDADHGVADRLAGSGDEVLGGGERFQGRAPGGRHKRAGAVDLLKLHGRRDLPRANAQQIQALDRVRPPLGIHGKNILEIVEADPVADRVIGAVAEIGGNHLRGGECRRPLVGAGARDTCAGARNCGRNGNRRKPALAETPLVTHNLPPTQGQDAFDFHIQASRPTPSLARRHEHEKDIATSI